MLDFDARFSQAMRQGVFVNLLEMTMPMEFMDSQTCFTYQIAEFIDGFHKFKIATKTHKIHKKV